MEAMNASEAVNEYLEDQEKTFYFEGIRTLEQRWDKCIALKGDFIGKQWLNFHFTGSPKYKGPRTF